MTAGAWSREAIAALLADVANGTTDPDDALERLSRLPTIDLGYARIDTHRQLRQHAPEAVLADGKAPDEVAGIVAAMLEAGAGSVMVTRADDAARAAVAAVADDVQVDERARLAWIARELPPVRGHVAMLAAGTSDGPMLREAEVRAQLLGTEVSVHLDVGVAGLHRLLAVVDEIRDADCVVVAAGMDAALASVVGGIVAAPVIGLPTSVGYGATFSGVSALLAMLTSCAAGVAVVNIDDGFGAGTIAATIARAASSGVTT